MSRQNCASYKAFTREIVFELRYRCRGSASHGPQAAILLDLLLALLVVRVVSVDVKAEQRLVYSFHVGEIALVS